MTEKNAMIKRASALPTLEQIAIEDDVDTSFRRNYIGGQIFWGATFTAGGCGAIAYAVNHFYSEGFSFGYLLLAGAGLFIGGLAANSLQEAARTCLTFEKEVDLTIDSRGFYLLKDKISTERTIVEKRYGQPVAAAESLELLGKSSSREHHLGGCTFLDRLQISDVAQRKYEIEEQEYDPEGNDTRTVTYYEGSFVLSRYDEERKFKYLFQSSIPTEFTTFLNKEEEFALLSRSGYTSCDQEVPFVVEKIYDHAEEINPERPETGS